MDIVKEDMKKYFEREGKTNKTLPLEGEGEGGGERLAPQQKYSGKILRIPLTLTLSLKGRGEISFDNPLP